MASSSFFLLEVMDMIKVMSEIAMIFIKFVGKSVVRVMISPLRKCII